MSVAENVKNVCLADAYIEDNILYAGGFEQNILLRFNMQSLELKWIGWFNDFKLRTSFQIRDVFRFEDSLFFFSKNSYEIAEYNLKQNSFQYYYPEDNIEENELIHSVCRFEDKIWMFGKATDTYVMVFSMEKRIYISERIIIERVINKYVPFAFESSICIDGRIWRCIPGSSCLLILDVKKRHAQFLETNLQVFFQTMNYDKGIIYILTVDGKNIVAIDTSTYQIKMYQTGYAGKMKFPFFEAIKTEKYLIFLPRFEKEIFCYEIIGEENLCLVNRLKLPKEFKKIHDVEHRTLFRGWKKINNGLYLLPFAGNGMLRLDLDSLEITCYPIKFFEKDYLIWSLQTRPIQSEKEISLKDYLIGITNNLQNGDYQINNKIERQKNVIWSGVLK
ncbi:MAG: hypothetical protein HFG97_01290 [Dorea sp.]|nr:hypothetical protein [Dorea sp.]